MKLVNDRHSTDFEVGVPKKMFQFNSSACGRPMRLRMVSPLLGAKMVAS